MPETFLSQILLYRYRYKAGYILFGVLLLGVIVAVFATTPHQLSSAEQASAVASAHLPLNHLQGSQLIDAPYHFLQKGSLELLGVTDFAIKLPSLIIGSLIAISIFFLMRYWLMRRSIALVASLIAITSSQFLTTTATGTPLVMTLFWMASLILLIVHIARRPRNLWLHLIFGVVAGLSLYTPLSGYLLASIALVSLFHPRLRLLLTKLPPLPVFTGLVIGLIITAPLIIAAINNADILIGLAGWPEAELTRAQISANISDVAKAYFLFWKPTLGQVGLLPFFSIPAVILIILGGIRLIVHHHTARSYQLTLLLPLLVVPIILQPQYAAVAFIPLIMLLALGIEVLMDEWYSLFPHNPYARIVIIVPLAVLLIGIITTNFSYYQDAYLYNPATTAVYSRDLQLARASVPKQSTATLVVAKNDLAFFGLLKRDFPKLKVVDTDNYSTSSSALIVSAEVPLPSTRQLALHKIQTDQRAENSLRFYVYRSESQTSP